MVFYCPTYMAGPTADFYTWMEKSAKPLNLAGKLGGVFATEQYIHGGADLTMNALLIHLLVYGMMIYSGGGSYGKAGDPYGTGRSQSGKKSSLKNCLKFTENGLPPRHKRSPDKNKGGCCKCSSPKSHFQRSAELLRSSDSAGIQWCRYPDVFYLVLHKVCPTAGIGAIQISPSLTTEMIGAAI